MRCGGLDRKGKPGDGCDAVGGDGAFAEDSEGGAFELDDGAGLALAGWAAVEGEGGVGT